MNRKEIEQGDYVRRAQAMLDAYPIFDVPREEWVEVCQGLLALAQSAPDPLRDLAQAKEEKGVWPDIIAPPQHENPAEGWEDPRLPDFRLIWKLAREVGYAVGIHGSLKRDVDLIAVPWTEEAVGNADLVTHLIQGLKDASVIAGVDYKPHGRVAINIQFDAYVKHIDLSVMPLALAVDRRPESGNSEFPIPDRRERQHPAQQYDSAHVIDPENPDKRLLLNAYGRACYRAGQESVDRRERVIAPQLENKDKDHGAALLPVDALASLATTEALPTSELLLLGALRQTCDAEPSGAPCERCGKASIMHTFNRLLGEKYAEIAKLKEQRDTYKTLSGIGTWHNDCRPNRQQAAREIEKSQAIINRLADEISRLQELIGSATLSSERHSVERAGAQRDQTDSLSVDPPVARVIAPGEHEQEEKDHGAGLAEGDNDTTVVQTSQLSHDEGKTSCD